MVGKVVSVKVDLVLAAEGARSVAVEEVLLDVVLASGGEEGREPVHVVDDAVADCPRLDHPGPAHHAGHAPAALPVGVFLTAERGGGCIRPSVVVRAIVGRIVDDRLVGDTEFIENFQELPDVHVVLDHAGGVFIGMRIPLGSLGAAFGADVGAKVHAGAAPPDKPRLAGLVLAPDEVDGRGYGLVIHGLHALLGQRPRILDLAVRSGLDHATRSELPTELGILWVVLVLGLLLGVEVVEVAEELVEAVVGRQVLVAVAEVVLAELAGGVALVLEQHGNCRVLDPHAFLGARQADLGESGAEHALAHDERRAAGRAALLAVVVSEHHALAGDAVDARRLVPHQTAGVSADVRLADVVTPDHQDVRLLRRRAPCGRRSRRQQDSRRTQHPGESKDGFLIHLTLLLI